MNVILGMEQPPAYVPTSVSYPTVIISKALDGKRSDELSISCY